MLPKPEKDGLFEHNYRPISFLPSMITERIIVDRTEECPDELELKSATQYDFKHHHNAKQQILKLIKYATRGLNRK